MGCGQQLGAWLQNFRARFTHVPPPITNPRSAFKAEENISGGIAKPLITSKTSTTTLEKVVIVIRAKLTEEPGYEAGLNQERLKVGVKVQ